MGVARYWTVLIALAVSFGATRAEYASLQRKYNQIVDEKLPAGSRVLLTPQELSAWAEFEGPPGVRNPKVELGTGTATGSALIDFGKLRRAQGYNPGWVMSQLLDGERPVRVSTKIRSANGQTTVDILSVEISGVRVEGKMLEFLIDNFLLAMYPDAAVSRPIEMGARIDRIEVAPAGATVVIVR